MVDPAAGMLAVARGISDQVDWRLETAEALSLPDASVDRALCQFGAMFFDDRPAAINQVRRVLKPSGEALFLVWDTLDNNPLYGQLAELFQRHFGAAAGAAMGMPFSLGDPNMLAGELRHAGFTVSIETAREFAAFPDIRALVEAELFGWLPIFDIEIEPELGERVVDEALTALAIYLDDGAPDERAARFPTSAHLIRALP